MFREPTAQEKRRNLATLKFGPLAILPATFFIIAIDYNTFNNIFDFFRVAATISVIGLFYGYFLLAVVGLPLAIFLCRNKKPSFLFVVFETIFISALLAFCFTENSDFMLESFISIFYYGLSVAGLSWYIYVKH